MNEYIVLFLLLSVQSKRAEENAQPAKTKTAVTSYGIPPVNHTKLILKLELRNEADSVWGYIIFTQNVTLYPQTKQWETLFSLVIVQL